MEKADLLKIFSRLSRHAFEAFTLDYFSSTERVHLLEDFDGRAFYQEILDSYGGSLHSVFIFHHPPIEVFRQPGKVDIGDPTLIHDLRKIAKRYAGVKGAWGMVSPEIIDDDALQTLYFLSNTCGHREAEYHALLTKRYMSIIARVGLTPREIGCASCDSFVDRDATKAEQALFKFLAECRDGIAITLNREGPLVETFRAESIMRCGVSARSHCPYEPLIVDREREASGLIAELEALLKSKAKESVLESFLGSHYREIFGFEFDCVQTQLWLRFPELDVGGRDRRVDVFLRNSVTNDWELFEVKRPVRMVRTYRNIPVLTHEVMNGIQQVRNYARILSQDVVKRHFEKEGIRYFEPSLRLVIGRKPQIPHAEWRWLLRTNEHDVKILTFDDLAAEMAARLRP